MSVREDPWPDGTEGFTYATAHLGGPPVGGIGELPASVPADVPPHSLSYFAVEDADTVSSRAPSRRSSP